MQAADGHQAAKVAALVVGLVVLVQTHLGGRPALQVARAVNGAEALTIGCEETERGVVSEVINGSGPATPFRVTSTCCEDDGQFLHFSSDNII